MQNVVIVFGNCWFLTRRVPNWLRKPNPNQIICPVTVAVQEGAHVLPDFCLLFCTRQPHARSPFASRPPVDSRRPPGWPPSTLEKRCFEVHFCFESISFLCCRNRCLSKVSRSFPAEFEIDVLDTQNIDKQKHETSKQKTKQHNQNITLCFPKSN